jgi:hypothetical protein
MPFIEKLLVGIATRGANGERVLRPLAAAAVKASNGVTVQQHMDDVSIHTSVTVLEGTMDSKITTAINLLKDGGDGSSLSTTHDTLLKISNDLTGVKDTLNTFLQGAADGGDLDRLIELVNAIHNNQDSIDALVSNKVSFSDIVNDLTTGGTDKVLSAQQGVVLADMITTLETNLTNTINGLHTHPNLSVLDAITVSSATGGLVYGGVDMGLKWVMHMTEAAADALTAWPADLAPGGIIMLEPNA